MEYTFEILGVSPILYFFNHQQEAIQKSTHEGVEYLGAHRCTLDAFIQSAEIVPAQRGWDFDRLVQAIVDFWVNNPERVGLWRERLSDAGGESLVVARVGNLKSLRHELESIFRQ
ncbi:hypothetical protein TUMEXPCC7403_21035 [Tumidithrix helvetica PCC 7403]|uniref:hypothetical protein n=1 Tax=Tumidithrix helvetica TaxID=3457545 RepID=UPI003C8A9D81